MEVVAGGTLFRDAATRLTAGEGCTARDGGVWCPHAEVVAVALGAGDDRATTARPGVRLDGGAGDDELVALGAYSVAAGGDGDDVLRGGEGPGGTLEGGAGDDTLTGGAGGELLLPGSGADTVAAGAGDDALHDESFGSTPTADADVYAGGPGTDELGHQGAVASVTVDLASAAPGAGVEGEGDAATGFEAATGGRGADVLRGDDGPNELRGGPGGRDRLDGRGGDDHLIGRVAAACGAGLDSVVSARRVARDCERATLATGSLRISARRLELRDRCEFVGRGCRARLILRDPDGAELARARARGRSEQRYRLRVALPARGGVVVAHYAGRALRIG